MIRLLSYFFVLLASVWLGIFIKRDPGYFLVVVNHWSIEMPLWVGALLLAVAFIVFHNFLNIVRYVFYIKSRLMGWARQRREQNSHSLTTRSILALTEGNWVEAEKLALKAVAYSDCRLIEYLIAARAAQYQGALARRDRFFRQAKKAAPQEIIAVELTQAQLQLESGQYEQALATVRHLHEVSPKQTHIIKLLYQSYERMEEWQNLVTFLPTLQKAHILTEEAFEAVARNARYELFVKTEFATREALEDFWQFLPKVNRRDALFIKKYVSWLKYFDDPHAAETHLKSALKRNMNNELLALYGTVIGDNPPQQLALAEHWLQQGTGNAVLLATLARIAMACEYWGKARAYFQESLAQHMNPQVAAEYGVLLEKLGETTQAMTYYKMAALEGVET